MFLHWLDIMKNTGSGNIRFLNHSMVVGRQEDDSKYMGSISINVERNVYLFNELKNNLEKYY